MKSDQLNVFLIKPKSIVQKAPIDAASFGLKIPEYIPPIVTKNIIRKSLLWLLKIYQASMAK